MTINSVAKRLYVLVLLIIGVYCINRFVQAQTEPPGVEMPDWSFSDLPMQLGVWQGEPATLDPEIAAATGAKIIADRIYRDDRGHVITLHSAMFDDPNAGIYHTPFNCYWSNGWKLQQKTTVDLEISEGKTIPVRLAYWEKEGQQALVIFWYQVGDHILYAREDMPALRWKMWGQPTWPVMMKIMLQLSVTGTEDPRDIGLNLASEIAKWINQPAHRKYLDKWKVESGG